MPTMATREKAKKIKQVDYIVLIEEQFDLATANYPQYSSLHILKLLIFILVYPKERQIRLYIIQKFMSYWRQNDMMQIAT